MDNPWDSFAAKYTAGSELEGEIKNITEFGLFIGLDGDVDGMVHLSDIDWKRSGEEAINAAFARFKDLADRKREIFDEDLHALISNEILVPNDQYQLVSMSFRGETGEPPFSVRMTAHSFLFNRPPAAEASPPQQAMVAHWNAKARAHGLGHDAELDATALAACAEWPFDRMPPVPHLLGMVRT